MKVKILIIMGVVVMILLAGCNRKYNSNSDNPNYVTLPNAQEHYTVAAPIIVNPELVHYVEITLNDINVSTKSMVRTVINNSDHSISFNPSAFALEFLREETWVNIDFSEYLVFTDLGYDLEPQGEHSITINLNHIPIEFEEGLYRIRIIVWKSFDGVANQGTFHHLVAEFEMI